MPVIARRLIRKMRGGAQAHLMEASDGHSYVVKFHNNPQHRRILVNEWIASTFLHYLGIAAPEVAMVQLTESFLAGDSETYIQLGRERRAVTPGWHFGSRFPGDRESIRWQASQLALDLVRVHFLYNSQTAAKSSAKRG